MGLGNIIRGQFIDVIDWQEEDQSTIVHKFEDNNKQIMMGAQLTVRPSQVAVFVNEGQIADVYGPGRHELTTQNMPVLTMLKSWKYGFQSPFICDIYFVSTHQFVNVKWGTSNPVMMRDVEFGMIRLRAFGVFAFQVADAKKLIEGLAGTRPQFAVEDIADQLRRNIVSVLSDVLADSKIAALDLASKYADLNQMVSARMQPSFEPQGLAMTSFTIENISLPPEVEESIDKRTSMGVIGNLQQYTQYQTAQAIGDYANNPNGGGVAGIGAAMGVGSAMVNSINTMNATTAPASTASTPCAGCGKPVPEGAAFCPSCGKPSGATCIKCGAAIPAGSAFCTKCGAKQQATCAKCGEPLSPGAAFCPKCGEKQG